PYPLTGVATSIEEWDDSHETIEGVPLGPPANESNPELNAQLREYRAAEERVRLQVRKQYPEIGLGPFFESDQGEDSLGLGLSLSLPLFNRNVAGIDEAIAQRAAKREAYIAALKGLRWQAAEIQAEEARVNSALERLEQQ